MISNQDLIDKFGKDISKDMNLANYSWFNLGGPAEFLFKPKNKDQLKEFLNECRKNKFGVTILGAGSNTLIRDKGVKGAVIKLSSNFSNIELLSKNILKVGAATLDRKVANFAKEAELGGLEFLSCIPGSIGGAIIMNSGCYETDISKVLVSINVIDKKTSIEKEIEKKDIEFFYRGTNLSKDFIIISAKLRGEKKQKKQIERTQNSFIEQKKISQPNQIKTCGSTFKNISKDKKAWMIIKEAGCEKFYEGDAVISNKHCNFFVNNGNANSTDIENLIDRVKQTVNKKTGINLELELKIIGEK